MIRNFSSSSKRAGISDVYSKLMRWSTTPKVSDVVASERKLYDPSKDSKASKDEMPDDSPPRVLEVLGKPRSPLADQEWVVKNFSFEAWPTFQYNSALTAEQIEAALEPLEYKTIEEKFETLKALATELKVAIPDRVLSLDKEQLKEHLFKAAKEYNEKTPDAVYLDRAEFTNTNVVIEPTPKELKALKARNEQLHKDAEEHHQQQLSKLLE